MIYHNENDADGIQQVLTNLHQYVSHYGEGPDRVYSSQGLVADQLSVERGVNALFELVNGFTPEERLEGLHLEIADWHAGNKFLKVSIYFMNLSLNCPKGNEHFNSLYHNFVFCPLLYQ